MAGPQRIPAPPQRHSSRSTLEARLYWSLGHGQTEAFFAALLQGYGAPGAELAVRIAADDPRGLRAAAIARVERHPEVARLCDSRDAEAYTAAQVYWLGAGVVFAQVWAKADPGRLRRYREIAGWDPAHLDAEPAPAEPTLTLSDAPPLADPDADLTDEQRMRRAAGQAWRA